MNVKDILDEELGKIVMELVAKYDSLGMRASGRWAEGLKVVVEREGSKLVGRIEGVDYTYYVQHGRAQGKKPPVRAIEEWIQAKGIRPLEKKLSVSSLAYAIAHKIGQEGTRRFKAGGKPEFIDAVITAERIQDIIDKVGAWYTVQFSSDIIKVIEEMAA